MLPKYLPVLISLLLLAGTVQADYHPIKVEHGGTIRGIVKYPGESPRRAMFGTRGDDNCPAGIPQEQLFVKPENRGIKNVLIVLDIENGKAFPAMKTQLDVKGCRFVPRIQWIPKSANLIMTTDQAAHRIRAIRRTATQFTVDVPARTPGVRRPLVDSGLHKINCERHLWERAWIYVAEHPYVTVTDDQGRFELTDVPAGTYTLHTWHEGWIEQGTEPTGQLHFQPMQQQFRVNVKRDRTSEILLEDLQPGSDQIE